MNLHSNCLFGLWTVSGCISYPRIACFAFLARVQNANSRCDDHFVRGSKDTVQIFRKGNRLSAVYSEKIPVGRKPTTNNQKPLLLLLLLLLLLHLGPGVSQPYGPVEHELAV